MRTRLTLYNKIINYIKTKKISLKTHLIFSIAFVHVILMGSFLYDIYLNQKSFIENQTQENVKDLLNTLAISSKSWVISRDVAGLNEIISVDKKINNLKYLMIISKDGKILSHTDKEKIGLYLEDSLSLNFLKSNAKSAQIVFRSDNNIDMAAPILSGNDVVGWVRISQNLDFQSAAIDHIFYQGSLYTVAIVVISVLLSVLLASLLTRHLTKMLEAINEFINGHKNTRMPEFSTKEFDLVSAGFNNLLYQVDNNYKNWIKAQTALIVSEERSKLAIEGTDRGLWDWDIQNDVVYYSSKWKEMLGYIDEEIGSKPEEWLIRLHPEEKDSALESVKNHIEGITKRLEMRYRMKCKNGSYIWVFCQGKVFYNGQKAIRMVGTHTDITHFVEIEQEKEKLFNTLRQSQKMEALGHFTSGISHDFKNILAAIDGYVRIISKLNTDQKTAERLNKIKQAVEKGGSMIAQLLAFGRGELKESSEVICLQNVFSDMLKLIHPLVTKNIVFEHFVTDEPLNIKIDLTQLQQIIMNLVINSRDAMGENGGRITISLASQVDDQIECLSCGQNQRGDWAVISISDTGSGITPENLKKIFDPFFSTKDQFSGTGMGLSIVHGIVHRNQGHISVNSQVGVGTEFSIYLPLAKADALGEAKEENKISAKAS